MKEFQVLLKQYLIKYKYYNFAYKIFIYLLTQIIIKLIEKNLIYF